MTMFIWMLFRRVPLVIVINARYGAEHRASSIHNSFLRGTNMEVGVNGFKHSAAVVQAIT